MILVRTAVCQNTLKNYTSWKEFWEAKAGETASTCSCAGCANPVSVGSFVQHADTDEQTPYIVPLCDYCSHKPATQTFYVRPYDMIALPEE